MITIDKEAAEQIENLAKEEFRSISAMAAMLIREALQKRKDK